MHGDTGRALCWLESTELVPVLPNTLYRSFVSQSLKVSQSHAPVLIDRYAYLRSCQNTGLLLIMVLLLSTGLLDLLVGGTVAWCLVKTSAYCAGD